MRSRTRHAFQDDDLPYIAGVLQRCCQLGVDVDHQTVGQHHPVLRLDPLDRETMDLHRVLGAGSCRTAGEHRQSGERQDAGAHTAHTKLSTVTVVSANRMYSTSYSTS
jgi:hypothetical protein